MPDEERIISGADLEKLLGRTLTVVETANIDLYLEIASERLESILCSTLNLDGEDTDPHEYDAREGYRSLFIDLFTEVTSVEIDGTAVESSDYSLRQWDRRSGSWYNSIVFKRPFRCDQVVEVTASWGFGEDLPVDLKLLLARLFALVSQENTQDRLVQSKQVEDFRIAFNTSSSAYDNFLEENAGIIQKYSLCSVGDIRHGRV
jgi:hypothetical protein